MAIVASRPFFKRFDCKSIRGSSMSLVPEPYHSKEDHSTQCCKDEEMSSSVPSCSTSVVVSVGIISARWQDLGCSLWSLHRCCHSPGCLAVLPPSSFGLQERSSNLLLLLPLLLLHTFTALSAISAISGLDDSYSSVTKDRGTGGPTVAGRTVRSSDHHGVTALCGP